LIRRASPLFRAPTLNFSRAKLAPLTGAPGADSGRNAAARNPVAEVPADLIAMLIDTAAALRAPHAKIVARIEKEDKDEQFIHEQNWQNT
jgi:hypothetical protein